MEISENTDVKSNTDGADLHGKRLEKNPSASEKFVVKKPTFRNEFRKSGNFLGVYSEKVVLLQ